MSKEKLIINKKNYEGYKRFYDLKTSMSNAEYRNNVQSLTNAFILLLVGLLLVTITPLLCNTLVVKKVLLSEIIALLTAQGIITVNYLTKVHSIKKEKNKMIKENYPYVDTNVNLLELGKSLEQYENNKNNDVDFEKYKLSQNNRVIEDGKVCFEDINRDEYFDCFSECQTDNNYTNNLEQTEKSKVKKLTK